MKSLATIYADMRETLADPASWTSGLMATSQDGRAVNVESPQACKFCLLGAAAKSLREPEMFGQEVNRFSFVTRHDVGLLLAAVILGRASNDEKPSDATIWAFNDALYMEASCEPKRLEELHAELLSVIDEAHQHAVAAGV